MELNDNVLDNIYSGDVSLLDDKETSMKNISENINTIIKNSPNPTQDPLINRVVTADINLTNLVDNYNSLCEKKSIQEEIVSTENICRNEAILINEVFGNLITPSLSLEEFTTFGSKTNYQFTLRHMEKTISKEEGEFINNYNLFLNNILKDVNSALEKLIEDYHPVLQDKIGNLKYHNSSICDKFNTNKNLVIPYGDGFSNIVNIDLFQLDPDLIKLSINNRDSFKKTVILFRQLLDVKEINSFIDVLGTGDFGILDKDNSGLIERSITISDLAKLVSESNVENIAANLLKEIQNTINDINNIKKVGEEFSNDFEAIKLNFIEIKQYSNEMINKANRLTSLTINLFNFIDTVSDLFDYTKQF